MNFDGNDDDGDDELAHQLPVSERFSFRPPTSRESRLWALRTAAMEMEMEIRDANEHD